MNFIKPLIIAVLKEKQTIQEINHKSTLDELVRFDEVVSQLPNVTHFDTKINNFLFDRF